MGQALERAGAVQRAAVGDQRGDQPVAEDHAEDGHSAQRVNGPVPVGGSGVVDQPDAFPHGCGVLPSGHGVCFVATFLACHDLEAMDRARSPASPGERTRRLPLRYHPVTPACVRGLVRASPGRCGEG
ncbi:hypothetical protein GCM10009863_28380 [Streptomyces axinellae]|uniref:Uncharacterized protein n=1 Tax=Streptomyces axinellae TaxID=552788 RepID=A0ABN3Q4E2_9ACTN